MSATPSPRPRRSVGWEIARWWLYAAALTPAGLLVIYLAGGHGRITPGLLIAGIVIMTVLAMARRRS